MKDEHFETTDRPFSLTEACRETNRSLKIEFARSAQQTSAGSQLLRQHDVMLKQVDNNLGALRDDLARRETQRRMEFFMLKKGHHATDCLRQRLDDLTSIFKNQSETLLEKLEQLQKQVEDLKSVNVRTPKRCLSNVEMTDD